MEEEQGAPSTTEIQLLEAGAQTSDDGPSFVADGACPAQIAARLRCRKVDDRRIGSRRSSFLLIDSQSAVYWAIS